MELGFAEEGERGGDGEGAETLEVGGKPGLGVEGVGFCEEVGAGLGADEGGEGGDGVHAGGLGGEDGVGCGCHCVGFGIWEVGCGSGFGFFEVDVGNGIGGSWGGKWMLDGQHGRLGVDVCICVCIRREGILEDCHFWACNCLGDMAGRGQNVLKDGNSLGAPHNGQRYERR